MEHGVELDVVAYLQGQRGRRWYNCIVCHAHCYSDVTSLLADDAARYDSAQMHFA